MKPVGMANILQEMWIDHHLCLNVNKARLQYPSRLLSRNIARTSIRSKGGKELPNELWTMILRFVLKEDQAEFWMVDVKVVRKSPTTMLVRCFRQEFDLPDDEDVVCDYLVNSKGVRDFNDYLSKAAVIPGLPKLKTLSGPANTFEILLDDMSTDHCLYTISDVPDFIATMNYGGCWVCEGERFICPGCTGGKHRNSASL
ncbi:hypothetical protein GGR52DRAFT_485990 [Hypoxylon sp. FL1284]|nr:hypothetical protein GGR52DRAFT_485990 [Hypoxylon sp. FL1284]